MKYLTLAGHAEREYAPDKIFAASQKAKAAIAQFGGDAVINSTLGECLDEDGKLMVLPTVERMIRTMPVEEICSYAPIGGIPGFNEAVQISLFGHGSIIRLRDVARVSLEASSYSTESGINGENAAVLGI